MLRVFLILSPLILVMACDHTHPLAEHEHGVGRHTHPIPNELQELIGHSHEIPEHSHQHSHELENHNHPIPNEVQRLLNHSHQIESHTHDFSDIPIQEHVHPFPEHSHGEETILNPPTDFVFDPDNNWVGVWSQVNLGKEFQFFDDGTYAEGWDLMTDEPWGIDLGIYNVEGNRYSLTEFIELDDGVWAITEVGTWELNGNLLILTSDSGEITVFMRIG